MAAANWDAYTLPDIWQMLRHENACDGADRIFDWDGLTHDVRTQHHRLTEAREELAAAWPPATNESARAFLDRMDTLAASMQQTLTRAEDTRAGLRGIIEAIAEAQTTVQPLIAQRTQISDDLIPRWADHAEDEYDAKARQAMRKAEAAIADHTTQLQPPDLFLADGRSGETGEEIPGGTDSALVGQGLNSNGSPGPRLDPSQAAPIPVPIPHSPPPPTLGSDSVPTGRGPGSGPENGPALSGITAPAAVNGVTAPGAIGGLGTPGPGSSTSGIGPGTVIGAVGPALPPGFSAVRGSNRFGKAPTPTRPTTPPGRQPVPVRTATPFGTVIGTNGGSNRAATPATGLVGQPLGNRPGDRRKRSGEGTSPSGVADQTWDVSEGVSPIIRPSKRRADHGPGPGVIGLDR